MWSRGALIVVRAVLPHDADALTATGCDSPERPSPEPPRRLIHDRAVLRHRRRNDGLHQPRHVVTLRPDPAEPERVSIVKLRDAETFRVQGTHVEVAAKLSRTP